MVKNIFLVFMLVLANLIYSSEDINYKDEMRNFVIKISQYAKSKNANFIIIPQNGHELLTLNGKITGSISKEYIDAIDGIGREDLFYGYEKDNVMTPEKTSQDMIRFLDIAKHEGKKIFVTDYCSDKNFMDNSYNVNSIKGYTSYAAESRELDRIPQSEPFLVDNDSISNLSQVKNFLYLINPDKYNTKTNFIKKLRNTKYDMFIIDAFFVNDKIFLKNQLKLLKNKPDGGTRLVIAYMSIGEAENYRYYWQIKWDIKRPSWIVEENPDWKGNFKVKYWDKNWQKIIYGTVNSYLDKIIKSGFDGVYLDIIDAFEYFEDKSKSSK